MVDSVVVRIEDVLASNGQMIGLSHTIPDNYIVLWEPGSSRNYSV